MSIYIEDNKTHTVRSYYTSPKIEETIEILLRSNEELMHSETLPGYKVDFVEEEKEDQDQKYCDRNICTSNEYNGVGCGECEVTKSQIHRDRTVQDFVNKCRECGKQKKGKWIEIKSTEYKEFSVTDMKCNCCNRYASLVLPHRTTCTYNFCPNCGAEMEDKNE